MERTREVGLNKGLWTLEEDWKLLAIIEKHGHGNWRSLPMKAGLKRCGKSCRLRWINYLRPDIKRGKFTLQEEQTIVQLHALIGNRWSTIATHLPKRTDNEIKNYWNTTLKKRLTKMGIDPVTHKPCSGSSGLSHMSQWESARVEAEARLVRESKLFATRGGKNPFPAPAVARAPCLDVLNAWQAQIPSSSACSSAFSAIMAPSGDHHESPRSKPSFPTAEHAHAVMVPLNDMPYHNNVLGSPQRFGPGDDDLNNVVNGGFRDLLLSECNGNPTYYVGENFVAGGEDDDGTTGIVSDENETQWNNTLMNLVTNNAVFRS